MGTIPHLRPPFPLFSSSIPRLRSVAAGSAFVLESAISAARCSNSPTPLYQLTFVRFYAKKKKMPPKKEVKQEKILLGRPGNNLKSGIVGLANVGKSTLFLKKRVSLCLMSDMTGSTSSTSQSQKCPRT